MSPGTDKSKVYGFDMFIFSSLPIAACLLFVSLVPPHTMMRPVC